MNTGKRVWMTLVRRLAGFHYVLLQYINNVCTLPVEHTTSTVGWMTIDPQQKKIPHSTWTGDKSAAVERSLPVYVVVMVIAAPKECTSSFIIHLMAKEQSTAEMHNITNHWGLLSNAICTNISGTLRCRSQVNGANRWVKLIEIIESNHEYVSVDWTGL